MARAEALDQAIAVHGLPVCKSITLSEKSMVKSSGNARALSCRKLGVNGTWRECHTAASSAAQEFSAAWVIVDAAISPFQ